MQAISHVIAYQVLRLVCRPIQFVVVMKALFTHYHQSNSKNTGPNFKELLSTQKIVDHKKNYAIPE